MLEWTIGIVDTPPKKWKKLEPLWEDELMIVSSSHSFLDVMTKLCETAIKARREYDYGVDMHLWNMKISSLEDAINPPRRRLEELFMMESDDDDDSDEEDDEEETSYRGIIFIDCPMGRNSFDDNTSQKIHCNTKLTKELLPVGSIVQVMYDYGTTTHLFLKILSIKSNSRQALLQYFNLECNCTETVEALKSVPAYHLPKDQQVDHYFPHASRAFLGYYVPLFNESHEEKNESEESDPMSDDEDYVEEGLVDMGVNRKVMGSMSIGMSGPKCFCTMESRTQTQDLLYAPCVLDPNELLQVVDKAWEPRNRNTDPDHLDRFRYDCISRWIVPSDDDEIYDSVKKVHENASEYGPFNLLFRLTNDRAIPDFDFQKLFPKTYAMLRSGKFRWIQYRKGVLRVIMGPGKGHDKRQFESKQILKTWKYDFETFHEILCLVETSWIRDGRELSPDTFVAEFDTVLEGPRASPSLVAEKDFTMISSFNNLKKMVTALAISEDSDGKAVLYSGHDDGTLSKWSLDEGKEIWSKQIYEDGTKDYGRYFCSVQETPGVAGIVVRPDLSNKHYHVVYTWTHAHDGYPRLEFDKRHPSKLRAWSGINGALLKQYNCDIGKDEDGENAHPSISTVVFCKLFLEERGTWVDSIIVGLYCRCVDIEYDEDFSDYDIEDAAEISRGNILPFVEHSNGMAMETWRGDPGLIRAMAVIESKYLLSCSIIPGHGTPHSFTLWSLSNPGVPLFRRDLYEGRVRLTRISDISGISICGKEILIAHDDAEEIVAISVCDDDDASNTGTASISSEISCDIKIRGYGKIGSKFHEDEGFHGRMAMSSSQYSIVANECNPSVWVFKISDIYDNDKLDVRDGGNLSNFEDDDEDEEDYERNRPGRQMALGKVVFPRWGGSKPTQTEHDDKFGSGGPVMIAIRGRWIVSGFSNGTLSKALLPEEFDEPSMTVSSNHLASCSTLPSDEWHQPLLEYDDYI